MAKACPTKNCTEPVPAGPNAVFCAECHFRLPFRVTNQIFALQIACQRTDLPEEQQHLREQIEAHVRCAARTLESLNVA